MFQVRVCEDPEECAAIWKKYWPLKCLFDLWEVRQCFAGSYRRQPYFLLAENRGRVDGILALARIRETSCYAQYPGETWQGKTWLEQNRIIAGSPYIYAGLLESVPAPTHLRYLTGDSVPLEKAPVAVDEVGYLFYPGAYEFSFANYMLQFSGKSRKKLTRELAALEALGAAYRFDHVDDLRLLFRMNLESFGESSYFYDPSFLDSFEKLAAWLLENKMLRITTLLLGGTVAAVDIGAVWQNSYTVLAGATGPEFPGVAKMINFHHLERACHERFEVVDFLCGDFGWKQRFHLSARPLYEMYIMPGRNILNEARASAVKANEQ
ncbi:MAG: GNAT family N-acetyltransferase [Desulfobulbaceae bacterium]|nr:GNAT family N-acetyltransferase [Desulfobulbaceae bacterium]